VYLDVQDPQIIEFLRPGLPALVSGIKLVRIGDVPLLAVTAPKQGWFCLPIKPAEPKPMSLRVAVPENAVAGDRYEFEIVQYDGQGHMVGGVVLQVNVVA
jgi:hypothetical protein